MVGIKKLWYKMSVDDVLEYFITNPNSGLTNTEAAARAGKFGFNNPDFINSSIYQFFKYSVVRDGEVLDLQINELVLGDIILLKPGILAPANLRLIKSNKLSVNEEHITGNPGNISKNTFALKTIQEKQNQKNMVFASSQIIKGRALGIVVSSGSTHKKAANKSPKYLIKNNIHINNILSQKTLKSINCVVYDDLYQPYEVIKSLQTVYLEKGISCVYLLKQEVINKLKISVPEAIIVKPSEIEPTVNGVYFISVKHSPDKNKVVSKLIKRNKVLYIYRGESYEPASDAATISLVITTRSSQISMIKASMLTDNLNIHSLSSILYNKK